MFSYETFIALGEVLSSKILRDCGVSREASGYTGAEAEAELNTYLPTKINFSMSFSVSFSFLTFFAPYL